MDGRTEKIPLTYWTFLVGTLAICGVPPLSGMISKDEILVALYAKNPMLWAMAILSAGLTTVYMFRLLFLTFYGEFRGTEEQKKHLHDSPWMMTLPLMILAVLSVVGGFVNLPHFIAHGEYQFLAQWLQPVLVNPIAYPKISFEIEMFLLVLTLLMVSGIIFLMRKRYVVGNKKALPEDMYQGWEKLSARKLYIDDFYQKVVVGIVEYLGKITEKFDRYVLDALVNFIGFETKKSGEFFRRIQNGSVETYLLLMSFGIGIILIVKFLM